MSRIVIVTGMSGAGRTSALKVLEDIGFEAVDNLPFQLLSRLLQPADPPSEPLAIGLDSRTRGLVPEELVAQVERVREAALVPISLVFFECGDEVLQRRFNETRRRHPMALDRPVVDGIALERDFMKPIKKACDVVFDTTSTAVTELRRWVQAQFHLDRRASLTLSIVSFGFKEGLPREADLVFDMRFLRNPHYVDELQPLTGLDEPVQRYVRADESFEDAFARIADLVKLLLPRYQSEGKSYLTVAIGCTGGKHRSVFVSERLATAIREDGWTVATIHRDIPRRTAA